MMFTNFGPPLHPQPNWVLFKVIARKIYIKAHCSIFADGGRTQPCWNIATPTQVLDGPRERTVQQNDVQQSNKLQPWHEL